MNEASLIVPRPAVDWSKLQNLSAEEAFVLSRLDAPMSLKQLTQITALSADTLIEVLGRLSALDAVSINSAPAGPGATSGLALPPELRERLLALDDRLGKSDAYRLLGVSRAATVGQIKAAYFEFCREFHPDRYFGKPLGMFEAPLLRVFAAVKAAYETLCDPEKRAPYDASLLPAVEAYREQIRAERVKLDANAIANQKVKARTLAAEAEEFLRHGDVAAALAQLKLACSFDPDKTEYLSRLRELESALKPLEVERKGQA